MPASRRAFRVESMMAGRVEASSGGGAGGIDRSDDILRELAEIRRLMGPQKDIGKEIIEEYRKQFTEAYKLKVELDGIQEAISRTKQEIATLHVSGFKGTEMTRVTDELDAVVGGTENATEAILSAAEAIDEAAGNLVARVKAADRPLAHEIQERVLTIFEACNFQDLTGQRITKVVGVLTFIEDRVMRMMEIWGGIESFASIEADSSMRRVGDAALLNGPALPTATNVASQDDIDALFA